MTVVFARCQPRIEGATAAHYLASWYCAFCELVGMLVLVAVVLFPSCAAVILVVSCLYLEQLGQSWQPQAKEAPDFELTADGLRWRLYSRSNESRRALELPRAFSGPVADLCGCRVRASSRHNAMALMMPARRP
jgi:hypothetical protein